MFSWLFYGYLTCRWNSHALRASKYLNLNFKSCISNVNLLVWKNAASSIFIAWIVYFSSHLKTWTFNAALEHDVLEIPTLLEQFSCYVTVDFFYNFVANVESLNFQRCVCTRNWKNIQIFWCTKLYEFKCFGALKIWIVKCSFLFYCDLIIVYCKKKTLCVTRCVKR